MAPGPSSWGKRSRYRGIKHHGSRATNVRQVWVNRSACSPDGAESRRSHGAWCGPGPSFGWPSRPTVRPVLRTGVRALWSALVAALRSFRRQGRGHGWPPPELPAQDQRGAVAAYWTRHNVTSHKLFSSRAESLEYFHWRGDQYPGYLELMPVAGHDGCDVLDFGCGPGDDIVGFLEYSRPGRLVGADVSPSSLREAANRARLHPGGAEFVLLEPKAESFSVFSEPQRGQASLLSAARWTRRIGWAWPAARPLTGPGGAMP